MASPLDSGLIRSSRGDPPWTVGGDGDARVGATGEAPLDAVVHGQCVSTQGGLRPQRVSTRARAGQAQSAASVSETTGQYLDVQTFGQ